VRIVFLFVMALAFVAVGGIQNAHSFPAAAINVAKDPDHLELVRQGCGKGWHRDTFGQCARDTRAGLTWNSRTGWGPIAPSCPNGKVRQGSRWVCR